MFFDIFPCNLHTVNTAVDVEVLRDRIARSSEVRESIGKLWRTYLERNPYQFELISVPDFNSRRTLVIHLVEAVPVRISTLFGEWLYLLRAALDGTVYYAAIRNSGNNLIPNRRDIYFPITDDASDFDKRYRKPLRSLPDSTFAYLRSVQPSSTHTDPKASILWWINELARIDRHRHGHALAAHIGKMQTLLKPPITPVKQHLPRLVTRRVTIDEPTLILDMEVPTNFDEQDIRASIVNITENVLDVIEWSRDAPRHMSAKVLGKRMAMCEELVEEIISPILNGCV